MKYAKKAKNHQINMCDPNVHHTLFYAAAVESRKHGFLCTLISFKTLNGIFTIAFHCSKMASLSARTSGQSKKL